MTRAELVNQLWELSHHFNGEKRTKRWLTDYIKQMVVGMDAPRKVYLGHIPVEAPRLVMTIALPDGEWYFEIIRTSDGFDYIIPDTRDEEQMLKRWLEAKRWIVKGRMKCDARQTIIISSFNTETDAERMCEEWGWAYDDGEDAYLMSFVEKGKW